MSACTGITQGRRCTCGLYHHAGGMRVEQGVEFDHIEPHEAIAAARMGGGLHEAEPDEQPGLFVSGWFWLMGCLCLGLWGALLAFLRVNGWLG